MTAFYTIGTQDHPKESRSSIFFASFASLARQNVRVLTFPENQILQIEPETTRVTPLNSTPDAKKISTEPENLGPVLVRNRPQYQKPPSHPPPPGSFLV